MVSESELRQAWGREVLRERGYKVSDTTHVEFELELSGDGCCELCYSEYPTLIIRAGSRVVYLTDAAF